MADKQGTDVLVTKNYQLTGRMSAPECFVEGASQVFFGYPITKIVFHTLVVPRTEESTEIRKAVQYLTMPTMSAIELANLILTTAKRSEAQLLADLNPSGQQKVRSILSRFQVSAVKEFESIDFPAATDASSSQGKAKSTKKGVL